MRLDDDDRIAPGDYVAINFYCHEISELPLVTHIINLDTPDSDGNFHVSVDRDFLRTVGEMAEW